MWTTSWDGVFSIYNNIEEISLNMKRIEFIQYRKLKNLKIDFDDNINIIAGTNGTCKSSILHLISNSHQKVSNSSKNPVLPTIQKINKIFNPKIEALARGDKKYNGSRSWSSWHTLYRSL